MAIGPFFRSLTVKATQYVDTIAEYTGAHGVIIDGLRIKDAGIGTAGTAMPICGAEKYIPVTCLYGEVAALDGAFFIADRAYKVQSAIARPLVVGSDGGAVSAVIRKAPSGTAAASGTSLHASGSFDLKGTINTNQTATLSATPADLLLAAGDALCIDTTGTTTAARGIITVALVPV